MNQPLVDLDNPMSLSESRSRHASNSLETLAHPESAEANGENGRYWDRTSDNLLVREVLYR